MSSTLKLYANSYEISCMLKLFKKYLNDGDLS